MSQFEDRKDAFEEKYAHDAEMNFKAEARACKLFGLWLAGELGLGSADAEAYAKGVVAANIEEHGFDDVVRYVTPDIEDKGLSIDANMILHKLAQFLVEAKAQLMTEA
ncbi:MAG: DUF1476 domain-containing protein [Rhodospirillales bacterium]|nr:DUF1476 domain-containing protein [Rhodospirillales bacterium]MCB9965595.1 DUF1476 domain-containing protein [Rhodospirillales bacterium]MCB9979836.1 DUF1476 domain-containing protein [Rhodospirillales bacterium]